MNTPDAYSMMPEEWKAYILSQGERSFRAPQIYGWLHRDHAFSYGDMTNLPKSLREKLAAELPLHGAKIALAQRSRSDDTVKYLMTLWDGEQIETVLMRYHYGYSLCISSQVGCRMGCRFCASTLAGRKRDLTAGEMVSQIYAVEAAEGVTVSHVVVMGCGEPFDNYDELIRFLKLITDPAGKNMSIRNLTVSTCGLTAEMRRFADLDLGVTLAVSLHASNDGIRRQIMPIANRVSMEELLDACRYYTDRTHRRITFEYALIRDVNDGPAQAKELAQRLHGMLAHVNLIPLNPVTERNLKGSDPERVKAFAGILETEHIPVTVRREMGQDIDAACGQLRRRHSQEKKEGEM